MGVTTKYVNKNGDVMLKYGILVNEKYANKLAGWAEKTGLTKAKILQRVCEKFLMENDDFSF